MTDAEIEKMDLNIVYFMRERMAFLCTYFCLQERSQQPWSGEGIALQRPRGFHETTTFRECYQCIEAPENSLAFNTVM